MKGHTENAIKAMASIAELVQEARKTALGSIIVGRPEGSFTVQEYADGPPRIGVTTARDQLKKAINAGAIELVHAVVIGTDGKPRATNFFRKVER